MTVSVAKPGGWVVHTYDIKAEAVEVLCDRDDDHTQIILYCIGLNVILRMTETEALRVASDIQAALADK